MGDEHLETLELLRSSALERMAKGVVAFLTYPDRFAATQELGKDVVISELCVGRFTVWAFLADASGFGHLSQNTEASRGFTIELAGTFGGYQSNI
jgi:hypothetical protein